MTVNLPNNFHRVSAKDADRIRFFTADGAETLSCEYAFGNLMAWGERYQLACLELEQRLWVYGATSDFLYFPLGAPASPQLLYAASQDLRQQGFSGRLALIPVDYYDRHREELDDWFTWQASPDNFEYVYRTDDLADLPGQKLSPKRNLISQFEREYPDWTSRELDPVADKTAVFHIAGVWAQNITDDIEHVHDDLQALVAAFDFWSEAGFHGTVLEAQGRLVAFAVYSMLTAKMADVHFEKALRSHKGSAQMINREAARQLRGKAEWINREQDLGVPGLRQAKLSYDPEHIIKIGLLYP
ncbi:MAG TPA: phosphatidylglycerol lysyltransferase domain-containing protein, partial [Lentisphaeria bacterium]|nr:phosphatidylglycerol lysyltransferase domain-containing protein [Lentisphaeria bacterium]